MPLVAGEIEIFNDAYEETRRSVVGLMIDEVEAGAGCIIHISPELTVVGVPSSCTRDLGTKNITVSFFDGTTATASSDDVVPLTDGGLDLLFLGVLPGGRREARLGQLGEGESETVLTIVPLVSSNGHRQRTYTSHVISPRCTCVNIGGSTIRSTKMLFAFTLPVGNMAKPDNLEKRWMPVDNFVLGAPVFNLQGEWVGFPIERAVSSSSDMKLGMRGEVFQWSLNTWLAGRLWEVAIQPYVERNAERTAIFDWY